jgi:exosortase/archaeosortase family protein
MQTKNKLSIYLENQHVRALVDVLIFAIIIIFFHLLWWNGGLHKLLLRSFAFKETEYLMTRIVFAPSAWIVNHILGIEIRTIDAIMYFSNNKAIEVNGTCSGLKQFYQWTLLMILFPGPWKKKLWFIPMGILIIHIVNVLRIVILAVIMNWNPDVWKFSHDWILRPFFYVVIFTMWMVWEERFRLPSLARKRRTGATRRGSETRRK